MSRTQTVQVDRHVAESVSGPVAGGLVSTLLALVHLFGVQVTGIVGIALYLVVWPVVGGAIAAVVESRRERTTATAGVLAGAYGALVISVVVLLAGLAGLWTPFVHAMFGVALWPVVYSVLVVTTLSWTVFGFASGFAVRRFGSD